MQTTKEDVKYVLLESIGFKSNYDRYYQITAIDLYSQKRVLKPVVERSHKIDNDCSIAKEDLEVNQYPYSALVRVWIQSFFLQEFQIKSSFLF